MRPPLPSRDNCIRAVAALVMALQDNGAAAEDVIFAMTAAARCEPRLRAEAAKQLDDMVAKITPENLHPPFAGAASTPTEKGPCPHWPGCGCGTQSGPHTCEWRSPP